jgi:hypothetical protein
MKKNLQKLGLFGFGKSCFGPAEKEILVRDKKKVS